MNLLVVSTDRSARDHIVRALTAAGHRAVTVDPAVMRSGPSRLRADAAIVDLDGLHDVLKVAQALLAAKPKIPVVAVAAAGHPERALEALSLGAVDLVSRPILDGELLAAVANVAELAGLAGQTDAPAAADRPGNPLFSASPAMLRVFDLVRRVAPSRCRVLIVGEPGTGRRFVARAVHDRSPWREAPFVEVECASARSGINDEVFERAAGGTLFLRQVDSMSAEGQLDLARRLGDGLTGAHDHAPGVRLLADAGPTVDDAVSQGEVRRELCDRLAVVRIDLPVLRERREDIPALAMHFLKEACREHQLQPKTFSRSARVLLAAPPWRGNLVELKQLVERLAILVPRGIVQQEDVLEQIRFDGVASRGHAPVSLREARERFEREFVASVLEHHRGWISAAAKALEIERTNLYRKIRQLGIP